MKAFPVALLAFVGCTHTDHFPDTQPPSSMAPPAFGGEAIGSDHVLPPPSGGTLGVVGIGDRAFAVASIPEIDRIAIVAVDDMSSTPLHEIVLQPGDEPGRVVADAHAKAHVALRGAGDVVTIDPSSGEILMRRHICSGPRGMAYDAAIDALHVACVTGELVTLPAAGGDPIRRLFLDTDLRDVVVVPSVAASAQPLWAGPSALVVSRFRSAEVLLVDGAGKIRKRNAAPPSPLATRSAHVAWRMISAPIVGQLVGSPDIPGIAIAYQLEQIAPVPIAPPTQQQPPSGYNGGTSPPQASLETGNGTPIVQAAFVRGSIDADFSMPSAIDGATPAVDLAAAVDGTIAVASGDRVTIFGGAAVQASHLVSNAFRQVTAVAFANVGGRRVLLAQWRGGNQGGAIGRYDSTTKGFVPAKSCAISGADDTGLDIFETPVLPGSSSISCASCHPEGGDDGHVWIFAMPDGTTRVRRTQSLRGGILATAPLHWDGDMSGMGAIAGEVFTKRMGGGSVSNDQLALLERFVDAIPRLPARADLDPGAVDRGRALFEGKGKCTDCHSGPMHTNNATLDVGKESPLQVPQLVSLGYRAPFMHDGCAATLMDRFDPACGGSKHGARDLTDGEKSDLVAYLQSL